MRPRNIIAVVLFVLSFVFLVPGLTRDLITLRASITVFGSTVEVFNQTRSILQTVRSLHESGNDFVAGLIFLFSVMVPFAKGLLLLGLPFLRSANTRYRVFAFVRGISKWAMADVFVVGVFIAYLSAKASDNLDADLGDGFYLFASYCLISLLALQFMQVPRPVPAGRA
ncbi:MAG: paraquat-inducible protein A [Acidobacteriota bacterium]